MLSLDRVIDYVDPAKNAMKDHPQNGMIDAPGNGYGQDTSEAPATYARRPTSVFHGSSKISVLSSKAGRILHPGVSSEADATSQAGAQSKEVE